jgi:hypothetical protein
MRPPGTRLRALAARLFAASTMERLVDPAIADLQAEYEEALRRGPKWRSDNPDGPAQLSQGEPARLIHPSGRQRPRVPPRAPQPCTPP